jgi:hypothetical protein
MPPTSFTVYFTVIENALAAMKSYRELTSGDPFFDSEEEDYGKTDAVFENVSTLI